MKQMELENLGGARILRVSLKNRGNILLLVGEGKEAKVLKLYRERQSWNRQLLSGFSHWLFERKRGVSPQARYQTELETLEMWKRNGFDVFHRLALPLPEHFAPPGLWLEYCPGRTLSSIIKDSAVGFEEKQELLQRLGQKLGQRHLRAMELAEPLLIQEHATINHLLIYGERMITFDFEGGFLQGFPMMEALAQEIAGYLRSLGRYGGERFEEHLRALVSGYTAPELLRQAAEWGVYHPGFYRRIRRWYDKRQRLENSKTDSLRFLLTILPASRA